MVKADGVDGAELVEVVLRRGYRGDMGVRCGPEMRRRTTDVEAVKVVLGTGHRGDMGQGVGQAEPGKRGGLETCRGTTDVEAKMEESKWLKVTVLTAQNLFRSY